MENEVPKNYELLYFSTISGTGSVPTSTVRVNVHHEERKAVASGVGSIDATFNALMEAIGLPVKVDSFFCNSISSGQDSIGEALLDISYDGHQSSGFGKSLDIVEAAAMAFVDALNKLEEAAEEKLICTLNMAAFSKSTRCHMEPNEKPCLCVRGYN